MVYKPVTACTGCVPVLSSDTVINLGVGLSCQIEQHAIEWHKLELPAVLEWNNNKPPIQHEKGMLNVILSGVLTN